MLITFNICLVSVLSFAQPTKGKTLLIPEPPKGPSAVKRISEFDGKGHPALVLLPAGQRVRARPGMLRFDQGNVVITVVIESTGKDGLALLERYKNTAIGECTSKRFKGLYMERRLQDTDRWDRLYILYSPEFTFSTMISWPIGDEKARKDGEALVSWVAGTLVLDKKRKFEKESDFIITEKKQKD